MNDERRFNEDEVAEILQQAASPEASGSRPAGGDRDGMTLAELEEIGAEVGIEPARIAAAAGALANRGSVPERRRLLGVPRSVSRTVVIPRPLDDDEWARLVVDLRETFGAQGQLRQHGTLRSWRNSNLQVHVEPDAERYRVRMRTFKGDAGIRIGVGLGLVFTSVVLVLSNVFGGAEWDNLIIGAGLGIGGLVQISSTRARLKQWAADRAAQMEGLAQRIPLLLKRGDSDT